MSVYILVVDDEPDVEALFRQQFRRDIRSGRFTMEFAISAQAVLPHCKKFVGTRGNEFSPSVSQFVDLPARRQL